MPHYYRHYYHLFPKPLSIRAYKPGIVETYLIAIDLPQGLTTNYGKKLDFKYEIKGTAEIIVNDRRLIERLFDNLKYRVK